MYNDTLLGSANSENFLGGYGDDFIDGRGGFDRAVYSTATDDQVTAGISVDYGSRHRYGDVSVGNDTLRSIEGITWQRFRRYLYCGRISDSGRANVGNNGTFNEFEGGGGNDTITGNGNTRVAFYAASDGVTVDLGAGTSHGTAGGDTAFVGTDTFTGVNAVAGSNFDDFFTGSNNAAGTAEGIRRARRQ